MHSTARRTGFTVLELVLALALSLGVAMAAMGLLTLLYRSDTIAGNRFEATTELAVAQMTIRRATQSLISGLPIEEKDETDRQTATPEDDPNAAPQDGTNPNADPNADPSADPKSASKTEKIIQGDKKNNRSRTGGSAKDATIADAEGRPGTDPATGNPLLDGLNAEDEEEVDDRDHFDLFVELTPENIPVQKLELVLTKSPVGRSLVDEAELPPDVLIEEQMRESIRGAFELVALSDGWALQWTPLEPLGRPTVLVHQLEACQWRVLPRRKKDDQDRTLPESNKWHDTWAAYLDEDYPLAIELSMRTTRGVSIQWLFDTNVTAPRE